MSVRKIAKKDVRGHFIITVRSAVYMTLWRDPFLQGRIDAAIKWNVYQRKRGIEMNSNLLEGLAIDIILLIAALAAFCSSAVLVWTLPNPLNIFIMTYFIVVAGSMIKEIYMDIKEIIQERK